MGSPGAAWMIAKLIAMTKRMSGIDWSRRLRMYPLSVCIVFSRLESSVDQTAGAWAASLLLLPHLVEEGERGAAPLRHLKPGELLVPHVEAGQHVERNHGNVARED